MPYTHPVSTLTTPRARLDPGAADLGRAPAAPSGPVVWIGRLAIVLFTILLVLGVIEVSLRLFGPILPGNYTSGAYLERHPTYGFFHVRGYEGWQQSTEYFARVRFSQLGLRDPRDRYEKPPGTFRILLLGDSFMEGVQVEQRETTAAVLEARLRVLRPGIEGVAGGVPQGWTLWSDAARRFLGLDRT